MAYVIEKLDPMRCHCMVREAGHNFPRYKQCTRAIVPGLTGPCGGHGTSNSLGLAPTCLQHSSGALEARKARAAECDKRRRNAWFAARGMAVPQGLQ